MPYLMGGFPDVGESLRIGEAYLEAGADVVELGVPFSDPLADGPVIQAAGDAALRAGATTDGILELAGKLAPRIPLVLMCYANPILARGAGDFAAELSERGVSGLIVPDLPAEEAGDVLAACDAAGVALVPLVAPTTTPERLEMIAAHARGFVYAVSVTGTTGERELLEETVAELIARAARGGLPVAVGFGISTPAQAAAVADAGADGVVVGSRLVRAAAEAVDPAAAAGELVGELASALT
jgi:tryptophan synthase alpha chain